MSKKNSSSELSENETLTRGVKRAVRQAAENARRELFSKAKNTSSSEKLSALSSNSWGSTASGRAQKHKLSQPAEDSSSPEDPEPVIIGPRPLSRSPIKVPSGLFHKRSCGRSRGSKNRRVATGARGSRGGSSRGRSEQPLGGKLLKFHNLNHVDIESDLLF